MYRREAPSVVTCSASNRAWTPKTLPVRRWQARQWQIVQDHLHALLRLHFDDVREEEWAPSYGGSRTRMDFLPKRERMVVETKMTPASTKRSWSTSS